MFSVNKIRSGFCNEKNILEYEFELCIKVERRIVEYLSNTVGVKPLPSGEVFGMTESAERKEIRWLDDHPASLPG